MRQTLIILITFILLTSCANQDTKSLPVSQVQTIDSTTLFIGLFH